MIEKFIAAWADVVVRRRLPVLIITVLFLGAMSFQMKNLYFDASNEMWFLKSDPSLKDYESLKDTFGSPQALLVGISHRPGEDSVITGESLTVIHEITAYLEDHEFINKVSSLSKYQLIRAEDDTLDTIDLVEDFEEFRGDPSDISRIREIMADEFLVHGLMITKDLNHTIIYARSEYIENSIDHKVKLVTDFKAFLEKQGYRERGYAFQLMGDPLISEQFFSTSMKDQATTFPLMFLLITVLLIFSFRTVAGVLTPWLVIIASIFSLLGVLGLFGWSLNMLNVMLPILIVVVGIGDSVHIIVEFYQEGSEGRSSKEAAKASVRAMFVPCFFTTVTTFIGFSAVSVTRLNPIREYGVVAGFGVVFALIFSLTTLPAILSFIKPRQAKARNLVETGWVARLTDKLTPFTARWSSPIVIAGGLLVIVSFAFATQVEVDSNFVRSFKKGTDIRDAMDYFDQTYNGGLTLEFTFDSGSKGGVKNPDFLREVLRFQQYAAGREDVGRVNSMINFIRKINQTMHNEDPSFYRIPESRELIAQYLLLYSLSSPEEDLSDLKSFDDRLLRLTLRIPNMTTSAMGDLVDGFKQHLNEVHPDLVFTVSGDMVLWTNMGKYIENGLVQSFSLAILAVMICFFVVFRSVRFGFLALIPSLTPIIVAGGLMVVLGIYMDFTTMIVASVTFGIAVDDTIHVMSRYIESKRAGLSTEVSVHNALTKSGRPVIFTSLILICGFSMLTLSSFIPNIYFGLFGIVIITMALVADLFLLPAAIFALEKKSVEADQAYPVVTGPEHRN